MAVDDYIVPGIGTIRAKSADNVARRYFGKSSKAEDVGGGLFRVTEKGPDGDNVIGYITRVI